MSALVDSEPIRVVCADDAPDAVALLRMQFALVTGVEIVEEVADGKTAVEAVSRLKPDLVVLDIAMPVMDGLEAAQQIRAEGLPTKILVLSAFSAERMRDEAIAAGADAYLEKGAGPDAFLAQLREFFPALPAPAAEAAPSPVLAAAARTPLERRYRALLDALEEAVVVVGPDGRVREANFAAAALLGRPTSRLIGAAVAELGLTDADEARTGEGGFAALSTTLRTGRPCSNVPVALLRPDGDRRWLLCSARPVRDVPEVGAPELLLSLLDQTEQHRAEQDLAASEHRLRIALETLPDFFGIYVPQRDADGRIVDLIFEFINAAGLAVLQRSAEEAVGHGMLELLPSHVELGIYNRYVRVVETGEPERFDIPWFDEAGVQGSFAVTAARMDGRLLILARDVSAERRAKREAEQFEQRFRSALDAMLDSVIIATSVRDDAGRIVDFRIDYINPVAEIGQRPGEQLVGRLFTEVWPGSTSGPTPTLDLYRRVVETGEALTMDSFHYFDEIGGEPTDAWFDLRATKLGDGFIQNFRDVTPRVRAAQQLVERAEALARSNADLQEFAYAASHDLRAPLSTVSGFAQLLERQLGDAADDTVKEYLAFIDAGIERATQMLDGLLAYSRVQTQKQPFDLTPLAEVLEDVTENLRGRLAATGAQVTADELPTVRGDRTQLVQLLQNLVANAITYVAPGVVPQVNVQAERATDEWQVSVTDNGIGIPERDRDRAFRLFRRVGDTEAHPGSGVGLALCRRIVARHGGRIWLDDAPGGGTVVRFTLADRPREDVAAG